MSTAGVGHRGGGMSLFWRVFTANAALLVAAAAVLGLSPTNSTTRLDRP
jgi:hypothetical protein